MTTSSTSNSFPIAIVGTGPSGLATALAVAATGLEVALLGPPPARDSELRDKRTAALFAGSIKLLKNLDVWPHLEAECAPIKGIRLVEDRGALLRSPEALFTAGDIGLELFGWNVPNAALTEALWQRIENNAADPVGATIHLFPQAAIALEPGADKVRISLAESGHLQSALVVGADGRQSICRAAAGIETDSEAYPQSAVVTTFRHSRPHNGISTEFHRHAGPLTVVPLRGNASSLVWVETPDEAARLKLLSEAAFIDELGRHLDGLLGEIPNMTPRRTFPLTSLKASHFGARRIALVGEAAHVMPPIGAQGLNLSLRDTAVLADVLAAALGREAAAPDHNPGRFDPGAANLLTAYDRARHGDADRRLKGIDMLNRSLLSDTLPLHLGRGIMLHGVRSIAPLRRALIREGLHPHDVEATLMKDGGLDRLHQLAAGLASHAKQPAPANAS